MSVREHRQGTKKIIVAKTKEEQITISTDQYASMLEEIQNLKDRGYEGYKNYCSGSCEKEVTTINFKDGSSQKIVYNESYHYTYSHVIEEEFCKD